MSMSWSENRIPLFWIMARAKQNGAGKLPRR
jgi:hypothetical protein